MNGMTQAMLDLETNYPDLVSIEDIGDSYSKTIGDGGYDIYVMKITASKSNPSMVLLTGGHHAREYAPPDITWILDTTQINVVLYVNPDGRAIAETDRNAYWRKNVNPNDGKCSADSIGTDLNRNYDWMWGETNGASNNPCDDDYHGESPASEPEVQAIVALAKTLFPEEQRKVDPLAEMDEPFGEDITGVYMDVHSYGGLTYYPWGFENAVSPDNDALESLGRKVSFFNGYVLWAGGQPDFLYPATGDASDYMYAHLGVASLGLEIGDAFYQDCDGFEGKVYPDNLNSLMYTIKLAKRPNALTKGPDVLDLSVTTTDEYITVSVDASDSELVNIDGYPSFTTGEQTVTKIEIYLDVLPEEFVEEGMMYLLQPTQVFDSDRVSGEIEISTIGLASGRHIVYAVATDSLGYEGPLSSVFFEIDNVVESETEATNTAATSDSSLEATETTPFTTTTTSTELESDSPTNKPVDEAEFSSVLPSNSPSIAAVSDGPSPVPMSQMMSTSSSTTIVVTASPSLRIETSAPTVIKMTGTPSLDGSPSLEPPTLSPKPSASNTDVPPSVALNSESPESSADRVVVMVALSLGMTLFPYLM
eukprot:scaffold363892_cov89-Cyclotella_meneghiniana.AAC.3